MRPTDFCHLNDLRAPVPRAFPDRSATFIAWTPPRYRGRCLRSSWSLGLHVAFPGDRVFHDTRERFGGS
jgi:hypothetical protein